MGGGPLVEAVPNFSEGRRQDVIDELVRAVQVEGVVLLHQTSDWDHNRTVLTLVGPPAPLLEALFRAVQVAVARIDLRSHRGAHPRIGAADVIPLIPIRDISLEECAQLARALGRRIGEELGLPVYLYESAATRPERRNLADIRRGEYEALVEEIHLAERAPDFGPSEVGPAGAVVVGARPFLIAYNIFLATDDVHVARAIARRVRARDGGLPGVKALGLLVQGQAQVSMNLVDPQTTPPHLALEAVRREAAQRGVQVERGELIGLLPLQSVLAAGAHALALPELQRGQVLELAILLNTDPNARTILGGEA